MRAQRALSEWSTVLACLVAAALLAGAPSVVAGQTAGATDGAASQSDTTSPPRAYGLRRGARRRINSSQLGGPDGTMAGAQGGDTQPPFGGPRQQLLERIRIQFEQIVRRRLQLTDDQLARLRETNRRFAPQRQALATHERNIRQSIRAELQPGVPTDEHHVAVLMDSLFAIQRERLDMVQSEQRELATYLTPSQRVRYYALQEQLRRRVEAMRQAALRAAR